MVFYLLVKSSLPWFKEYDVRFPIVLYVPLLFRRSILRSDSLLKFLTYELTFFTNAHSLISRMHWFRSELLIQLIALVNRCTMVQFHCSEI